MMLIDSLREAALKAATYLTEERRSSKVIGHGSFGDVTKAFDKESEEIVIETLRQQLGEDILIVSEEVGILKLSPTPKWVVIMDPVDGSTNYDSDIPWVSVAVAAGRYSASGVRVKDIEAAAVADVFRSRIYEFSVEGGVKVNGESVTRRTPPAKVLLGYFEVPEAYQPIPRYWVLRGGRAALRSLGSAALDIVYVGLGRAEGFMDARAKLRNVDVAASLAIATHLGAYATRCDGESALDIRIDQLERVECIVVGYNKDVWRNLYNALKSS